MAPAFYKDDKYKKYLEQWNTRLGLESIKMRQMIEQNADIGNNKTARAHKAEIQTYIANALAKEKARGLNEVYITDHTPRQKRYHTANKKEDEDFYRYEQSLKEYNEATTPVQQT